MNFAQLDPYLITRKTILGFFWFALGFTLLFSFIEIAFHLWIDFPFNYYESEVVMDAHQYRSGNQVYLSPTEGPFAGLYAPFFSLFGAFLYLILPESLLTLRFVTVAALFGVATLYWKSSEKQTILQFLFAIALVFVWHNSVAHFDLHAKSDSFSAFLGLLSVFLLFDGRHKDYRYVIASAIVVSLSFSSKQNMLFFLPAIIAGLFFHKEYKAMFIHGFTFLGFTGLIWIFFYLFTGPAVFFYSFIQPGNFDMRWGGLDSAPYSILRSYFIPLTVIFVLRSFFKGRWDLRYTILIFALILAYPASIATAIKGGGLSNAYQPFFYILSFLFIISFQIDDWIHRLKSDGKKQWIAPAVIAFTGMAFIMTMGIGPASTLSTWQYRINAHQEYERLADDLRRTDGVVFAPMDNYLTLKIGRPYVWSAKWEIETAGTRTYHQKALQADHVITINWNIWYKSTRLEDELVQNGFTEVRRTRMDQQREYVWWKAPDGVNHE